MEEGQDAQRVEPLKYGCGTVTEKIGGTEIARDSYNSVPNSHRPKRCALWYVRFERLQPICPVTAIVTMILIGKYKLGTTGYNRL